MVVHPDLVLPCPWGWEVSVGGKVCAVQIVTPTVDMDDPWERRKVEREGMPGPRLCVNTYDGHAFCAVHVDPKYPVRVGDSLWWQGEWAYWRGSEPGSQEHKIPRIGYSHDFCGAARAQKGE
jgi:hypothetical protein